MVDQELGSSENLSAAVESVTQEAPKLSGLDKLRDQKAYVEKNDALPPKSIDPTAAAGAKIPDAVKVPVPAATDAAKKPVVPIDPNTPAAAYTPNYKYKASGKEMEIPEKFRALMIDKESEEEVKKLFGQAGTLDEVKSDNTNLKKNIEAQTTELTGFRSGINQLRGLAQKNDWDTWFQKLNINPERIYQWVLDKVQYNQLPPEQRAQLDQQRNLQRQAEMAQENLGQASTREMQLATQVKGMQLEQTLGTANVKSMVDAFDSRAGRPGAFKEAIIEHGKAVWALSNSTVDLTPEQAVEDFVKKYGNPSLLGGQTPAAGVASPTPSTGNPGANSQPAVKVIPNVAGRSASPLKQKPRNLEDLKRLRDTAIKEDNASRSPSQGYLAG